ncbi:DUF2334 domain-containing protein [Williamsia sp. CHRR-6]|uniref:DUF2334 domain-containing protein n=1 Tax=Williamsia sp. CHRR-6 TaxID=2835871 RepID=UPI001BDA7CF5|nr:DUF2334 domain-containing protein [Williamsia sp. CHRR-6]MBT0568514.1 DUF2334 domain-containing protein [Williamsia sp. CHRR-6]
MSGLLFVSLSGIRADTLDAAQEFTAALADRGVPVSLLVSPRLKHGYRLLDDPDTVRWLRHRRSGADAIVLHGYDQAPTKSRRAEFAVVGAHEARLRLAAADRVMETAGLRTRLFAAPRWTSSQGALKALPQAGFRVNLGFTGWDDLVTGEFTRARVLGFGDGFRTDAWWCRMVAAGTGLTARRGGIVRLSVAAKHLRGETPARSTLLAAVDHGLDQGLTPTTYRALAGVRSLGTRGAA